MPDNSDNSFYIFPAWSDKVFRTFALMGMLGVFYVIFMGVYFFSPQTLDVGYAPIQPVPYSHALHAGELGMDCRYCHNTVEIAAQAAIPPTQTCMNCHKLIKAESEKLLFVRESYATGMPINWVRVHDLPDFVYFNHSAHISSGISCVACHQRIDKMEVVYQAETLRMNWCTDCHRAPEQHLRPVEFVTDLGWVPNEDQLIMGKRLKEEKNINPSVNCSTCHR